MNNRRESQCKYYEFVEARTGPEAGGRLRVLLVIDRSHGLLAGWLWWLRCGGCAGWLLDDWVGVGWGGLDSVGEGVGG